MTAGAFFFCEFTALSVKSGKGLMISIIFHRCSDISEWILDEDRSGGREGGRTPLGSGLASQFKRHFRKYSLNAESLSEVISSFVT
jgi:hypothetical protein